MQGGVESTSLFLGMLYLRCLGDISVETLSRHLNKDYNNL